MKKYLAYTGVLGVVIIWFGTILGMIIADLSLFDSRPISYVGVHPDSQALFTYTLLSSASLFSVYGAFIWKKLDLSNKFLAAYLLGQAGQMVAGIVPYGGPSKIIHTLAAFTLAFSIPIHLYLFAVSHKPEAFQKLGMQLYRAAIICFVVGIGTFVFIKKVAPLTEILPALPFHVWLIITGMRLRKLKL